MSPFSSGSAIIFDVNYLPRVWNFTKAIFVLGSIIAFGVSSNLSAVDRELYKAYHAIETGQNQEASVSFAQAAEYIPWRDDLWEQAGIYALLAGEQQVAKSYLERLEREQGLSPRGLIALGDIANLEGNTNIAIGYWESALSKADSYELHYRLADAYYKLKDFEKALVHQTKLVEVNPTDKDLNLRIGLILAALEPNSAPAYLSHAVDLDPDLAERINPLIRSIRSSQRSDDPAYAYVSAGQWWTPFPCSNFVHTWTLRHELDTLRWCQAVVRACDEVNRKAWRLTPHH